MSLGVGKDSGQTLLVTVVLESNHAVTAGPACGEEKGLAWEQDNSGVEVSRAFGTS